MTRQRLILAAVLVAPFLVAWGVAGAVCGFTGPREINCYHASDGYWEIYFSFLIMFSIAIWIGGGFIALTLKLAKARKP
ncbi:MAG: hypothetical protein AAGA12_00940 [Pseudomonadota bacterium]